MSTSAKLHVKPLTHRSRVCMQNTTHPQSSNHNLMNELFIWVYFLILQVKYSAVLCGMYETGKLTWTSLVFTSYPIFHLGEQWSSTVRLSVHSSICLSLCPSIHLSTRLSVHQSVHSSIWLSTVLWLFNNILPKNWNKTCIAQMEIEIVFKYRN